MSNWPSATVAALQGEGVLVVEDGNHGEYRPRPDEFVAEGTSFIRAADLADGEVDFDGAGNINEVALRRLRKGIGEPGDILFSHKGTVGKLARVPDDAPPFVCSPQTTFWRVLDDSRLRRDYLYAFMRSRAFIEQWRARKGETDMADYVSLTAQRQLRVVVPPIDVQRRIAAPLSALDDLIENNRRRIKLLEQMARAIYREWFVHFRYPGHEAAGLVDSPEGPIPDAWDWTTLGDAARWLSGGTPRTSVPEYWNGDIPWITSGSLTSRFLDRSERMVTRLGAKNGTRLVDRDTLLFVVRGMSLVKEFRVGITDVRLAFGQDCKALVAGPEFEKLFLGFAVIDRADEIQGMVELAGHGTGKLSTDRLKAISVLHPPAPIQRRFVEAISPIRDSISHLRWCNDQLAALRDLLLPKLVSGQIDVSHLDLEALVEATSA
jgi:type I restriction enzyme S subunit